jgi:DNA repair photolyase
MSDLFPDLASPTSLVGIAKLAAEGEALADGHDVEYLTIENRSLLTRCTSSRVPFEWMINPYRGCEFGCKYCYARYTHEFMELRDSLDFERRIYVKQHTGWLLRQELKRVRRGQQIAIGTATDPYQPAERKFLITRSIMEEFARHEGLRVGLVTKSNLILRDLDVLRAIAEKNFLSVHVTITTLRTDLARILEPRAPRPDLRLQAVAKLAEAGISTSINCAPVLPALTDAPADLEEIVKAGAQAGAKSVWASPLFLKQCSAKVFLPFLQEKFPHLVAKYRERYADRAFASPAYQKRISTLVKAYREKYGMASGEDRLTQTAHRPRREPECMQMGLFAN